MALQIGQVLQNRYRIVSLLGQGGYGAVYRAWDLQKNEPRALKENQQADIGKQFEVEANILKGIQHPSLPKVYDLFSIPNLGQYLVMEFVEGKNLQLLLEEASGPLPVSQVLGWIGQICDALTYLHNQPASIIHRDINPKNIIINAHGHAMLVDFGIAKYFQKGSKTTQGARAVTPGYAPPEQYGYGSTDARSDIYALGVTTYVLLTGVEYPESVHRLAQPQNEPQPARSINPLVPQTVSDAIQVATQIDQTQRFSSVAEFKRAFSAPMTRKITQPSNRPRLSPAMVIGIIGLMAMCALGGAGLGWAYFSAGNSQAQQQQVAVVSAQKSSPQTPTSSPTPSRTPANTTKRLTPTSSARPVSASPTSTRPRPTNTRVASSQRAVYGIVNVASANARSGPGKVYPVLVYYHAGERLLLEGRTTDGSWVYIHLEDTREAWISVTVLDLDGLVSSLPVKEAPPPPKPEATWTPGPRGDGGQYP